MKSNVALIGAIAAIVIFTLLAFWFISNSKNDAGCTFSGGVVKDSLCCNSASDFPNTCLIGACGCSPEFSHHVKGCECPEGKCFDGEKCA
jgi:hypothetical protein